MVDNGAERVRVLQSFGVPRPTTNPYLVQLVQSLPAHVTTVPFSWRTAVLGRYDVVHLHWPELLLRGRSPARTAIRSLLTVVLLVRWTLLGTPLVRTLHNAVPHEPGPASERWLLSWIDRRTDRRIALNEPDAERWSATPVLHGHYRGWFGSAPHVATMEGRLVFAGLIRPYKNVPHLLRAFADVGSERATLVVAGAVRDDRLAGEISTLAAADRRVTLHLEHLSDDRLARTVQEAAVVVLPYREMTNSGAAILALSFDRPVLLPRTPANESLAAEVGSDWVRIFDGELTTGDLETSLAAPPPARPPDLGLRSWGAAGSAHAEIYADAVRGRRAR